MRKLVISMATIALLTGCQQAHPIDPARPPMGPTVSRLKQEGDELARRHEWPGALEKYQAAVNRESSNLDLRLAYGIALSHLDRREETIEQFRWVVNNSRSGSPEFVLARTWLVEAGAMEGIRVSTPAPQQEAAKDDKPKGIVQGRTSWPGVSGRLIPLRITLSGEDPENRDVALARRFRLGEPYRFADARPGKYRLRAVAIDQNVELWDKPLVVEAGKETRVDLSDSDSQVSTKEFPTN